MTKRTLVADIESNGLVYQDGNKPEADTIWMIVAIDVDTNERFSFTNQSDEYGSIEDGLQFLYDEAKVIAGHNWIGYDAAVLKKLYNWEKNPETLYMDTMLMSQYLNWRRFGFGHSLAHWGKAFNFPKGDFNDFSQYSEEMLKYCMRDVELNVKVFLYLLKEFRGYIKDKPLIKTALRQEHDTSEYCARMFLNGWLMDKPKMTALMKRMAKEMKETEEKIEPKLGAITRMIDKEPRTPQYKKNGEYTLATARQLTEYLGQAIDPSDALTPEPPMQPGETFQRKQIIEAKLGNQDEVKVWLQKEMGWEPYDWNWKKIGGKFIKMSPKLCSESLAAVGPLGVALDEYYTTRARYNVLKGWKENLDENNRIHGSIFTIGTPTGRARHSGVVNVPGTKSTWGKEIRELFITEPGWKVVGADSSGNQLRAFAHYLKSEDYTNEVINGDAHQRHADYLNVTRDTAKPLLYAYLFGSGFEKLSLIATGVRDSDAGRDIKKKFIKAIPGLDRLNNRINEIYHKTERGKGGAWLPGLAGQKVYTDSSHKGLNYVLQSFESTVMKASVSYAMKKLDEEIGKDNYRPLQWVHDEIQLECKEEHVERVAEILEEALTEAPKAYDVNILTGESKYGDSWLDTLTGEQHVRTNTWRRGYL